MIYLDLLDPTIFQSRFQWIELKLYRSSIKRSKKYLDLDLVELKLYQFKFVQSKQLINKK